MNSIEFARRKHKNVPPDWYTESYRNNIFQRFWHGRRIKILINNLIPSRGVLLDIGCCDGFLTDEIVKKVKPSMAYGIDVLERCVDFANKTYGTQKLKFKVGDAHKLKFRNSSVSTITCFEALEHVRSPKQVLNEMYRVLKPGGKIYVLVPQENLLFRTIWFFWERNRGKIWKHTHIQSFSVNNLNHLSKASGFKKIDAQEFLFSMLILFVAEKPVKS